MADLNAQARLRQDSLGALERAENKVSTELQTCDRFEAEYLLGSLRTTALVGIAIGVLTLSDEVAALRATIEKGKHDG